MMNVQLVEERTAPLQIDREMKSASTLAAALVGTWKNVDDSRRNLTGIVIAPCGSGIVVDACGSYSPTQSNWGSVTGLAYAAITDNVPAVAFSAQYTFYSSHVILIGRLHGRQLIVESFTQFNDGSGRANLYTADTLMR